MSGWNRTLRTQGGKDVAGSWRHIFIRNGGTYFLTDLKVFADGVVDCWGLVTLEEFRDKLRSGWVATSFEEGARASVHEVASWTFTDVQSSVDAGQLYLEVLDEIETLNGRPDSGGRCLAALETYLADETEANRRVLEAAYRAIPGHRRRYVLGDMDAKDWPLRVLITPAGRKLNGERITEEQRAQARRYFAERTNDRQRAEVRTPRSFPSVIVPGSFHPGGWPDPPGILVLQTQYPAPVAIGDVTYPTVEHAFWALRTTDRDVRAAVLAETNPWALPRLAAAAPARDGWDGGLTAVMAQLLRVKFRQHENLAQELLATGEGRILFQAQGFSDAYDHDSRREAIGRLLELIRAEQRAWRSGLLDSGALN